MGLGDPVRRGAGMRNAGGGAGAVAVLLRLAPLPGRCLLREFRRRAILAYLGKKFAHRFAERRHRAFEADQGPFRVQAQPGQRIEVRQFEQHRLDDAIPWLREEAVEHRHRALCSGS